MKKPLIYKEEDGTKYKISFSEELQMKNLREARKQIVWNKRNFYAKVALILVMLTFTISFIYLIYRLDLVNFFSYLMYR